MTSKSSKSTSVAMAATTFADLPLHDDVQRALARMHFRAPSPIQLRALPLALFGNDVVGQAKSGTGKTAVFGVTAVEHVIAKRDKLQSAADGRRIDPLVLVLAPTREIALQIDAVLRQLAHFRPTCTITTAIGGLPLAQDKVRTRTTLSRSVMLGLIAHTVLSSRRRTSSTGATSSLARPVA